MNRWNGSRSVTITRDSWGIGHASAGSADDAFWAQGWMAASDRIWQMEWDRLRAFGRWASVVGPSGLAEDKFFRRIDLSGLARRHWEQLDPQAKAMTEAYCAGVNAWLAKGSLPAEFEHHPHPPEPWEPWHCLAVYKLRHIFMGTFHKKLWRAIVANSAGLEVLQAMVGNPASQTPIVAPRPGDQDGSAVFDGELEGVLAHELSEADSVLIAQAAELFGPFVETEGGSNSWAIDGTRTRSGRPLVAGDPHRGIEFPNVYYQSQLTCPAFDVIGLAFPGVPGFAHFGHNQDVAWCITHGMADDTDIYIETGPFGPGRIETIEVRGEEPIEIECYETSRGPIVLGADGSNPLGLGFAWTGLLDSDSTFNCLYPMLEASSVDELEQAVSSWVIPVNNLISADRSGDISFRLRGSVIERPTANRWIPIPGTEASSWTGLKPVPYDELHQWKNPDRGFLVTANNRIGDKGPYISLDYASSARHDRIVELLSKLHDATVADMATIHGDVSPPTTLKLAKTLVAVAKPSTGPGQVALQTLADWDGELAGDSGPAAVYSSLRRRWSQYVGQQINVLDRQVSQPGWPSAMFASRLLFSGASNLLSDQTYDLIPGIEKDGGLGAVLGRLIDETAADLGPDPASWRWDSLHTMVCPHPLASALSQAAHLHPPVDGVGGDSDTVRAAPVAGHLGDQMAAGSVARYAFDLADWDQSQWVVPHGVSGIRDSGHDLDQRSHWLQCQMVPMWYSAQAVAANAKSTTKIEVE